MKPQNMGTKIRTLLGILTTINTVLAVTDVTQFGNETVTAIYKLISVLVNAVIVGINTWYNNDYTEAAAESTGKLRQAKREKADNYIGDTFYQEYTHDYEENEENRGGDPNEEEEEEVEENEQDAL